MHVAVVKPRQHRLPIGVDNTRLRPAQLEDALIIAERGNAAVRNGNRFRDAELGIDGDNLGVMDNQINGFLWFSWHGCVLRGLGDLSIERLCDREIHSIFWLDEYAPEPGGPSVSKPFDATLKDLLEIEPTDWPILIGLPPCPVDVIDADISTISGAADKVLKLRGPSPSLMSIDFQS